MAASARLRWTLVGFALVALAAWVVWTGLRNEEARDAGPEERMIAAVPDAAMLEARAAAGSMDHPASTTRVAGAPRTLRLVAPDGRPAAGAAVLYGAFEERGDSHRGTADRDGVVKLAPALAARPCHIRVAGGATWAESRFDVLA